MEFGTKKSAPAGAPGAADIVKDDGESRSGNSGMRRMSGRGSFSSTLGMEQRVKRGLDFATA